MSNPSGADGCTRCCSKFCGLLFFAGFLVFDFWLIFRPRRIGASVDSASLTEFALSPSGALLFNLTADLSLRNPNSRIGVYYDRLDAAAFYSGALLGPADSPFPEFYQHPKTTTAVSAVFKGRTAGVGAGVSDAFAPAAAADRRELRRCVRADQLREAYIMHAILIIIYMKCLNEK
ncbi:Protein YLS9 [Ananas comosus]|uniref:Protein YLS9 n=1 Tax=Ananas comosus TaxID=4615 RepID=A0A199VH95_ANACO|nr:Protein YLS9 [Ananas comosus]